MKRPEKTDEQRQILCLSMALRRMDELGYPPADPRPVLEVAA